MTNILTSLGVGSGMDIQQLAKDLASASREPKLKVLTARQDLLTAKVSALAQVRSAVDALANSLSSLASSGALTAQPVSGDSSILTLKAKSATNAVSFSSTVEVGQLASGQTLMSASVFDAYAPIGQGSLTINFGTVTTDAGGAVTGFAAGSASSVTVNIDSSNDSLVGLQQAINSSGSGVTASIITDTTGPRLVLKGATGAANGFTVDVATAAGSPAGNGLQRFAFDSGGTGTMVQSAAASNAQVKVDGISYERTSNNLTDVIDGYTLSLVKAAPGAQIAVGAQRSAEDMKSIVADYASAFNEVQGLVASLSKTGDSASTAGPLRNEASVRELKRQLGQLTSQTLITGDGPRTFAEIGLKTNRDGTLSVDDALLSSVLESHPDAVEKLFVASQSSSSPLVAIKNSSGAVQNGTYSLTNLVAATAGTQEGTSVPGAFASPVTIDATNSTFDIMVDGRASTGISIAQGTYATGEDFAAALQQAINGDAVLAGFKTGVTAFWDGDSFLVRSQSLGRSSAVSITGLDPTLAAQLGLSALATTAGTDASGMIDGKAGIGSGNQLLASATTAAKGLIVQVSPGASSATITVSDGVSGTLLRLQTLLNGQGGGLASTSDRYTRDQAAISDELTKVEETYAKTEEKFLKQFSKMEAAVASFKSTQEFMQQQIDLWSKNTN